jgi:hypothetical protein
MSKRNPDLARVADRGAPMNSARQRNTSIAESPFSDPHRCENGLRRFKREWRGLAARPYFAFATSFSQTLASP